MYNALSVPPAYNNWGLRLHSASRFVGNSTPLPHTLVHHTRASHEAHNILLRGLEYGPRGKVLEQVTGRRRRLRKSPTVAQPINDPLQHVANQRRDVAGKGGGQGTAAARGGDSLEALGVTRVRLEDRLLTFS